MDYLLLVETALGSLLLITHGVLLEVACRTFQTDERRLKPAI